MRSIFSTICLVLWILNIVVEAQETAPSFSNMEPITAENMDHLERVGVFGRGTISTVAWSPDGSEVAVAGSAGVWVYPSDDIQAEPLWLDRHTGHVNSVVYHPDGNLLFSSSNDGRLWVYSTTNYAEAESYCFQGYEYEDCSSIYGLDLTNNGKLMAIALNDHIVIWDVEQREIVYRLFNDDVNHVEFALDDTMLVATPKGRGQAVQFWKLSELWSTELNENSTVLDLNLPYGIWDMDISKDSQSIVVTGFDVFDSGIALIDVAKQELVSSYLTNGNAVTYVSESMVAGAYLAFNDGDTAKYGIHLINLATGETEASIDTGQSVASDIVLSEDGDKIAIGTLNGNLFIYEVSSGAVTTSSSGIGYYMCSVEFSDDGRLGIISGNGLNAPTLAGGGSAGGSLIYLWDIETNTYLEEITQDNRLRQMTDLQATQDERFLVSGDEMFGLVTWSPQVGFDNLVDFPITYNRVSDIELSIDRRFLIASLSGMSDDAIAVIDLDIEPPKAEFYEVEDSNDPRFGFYDIAIHPNQPNFSVSTLTGQVYNWNIGKSQNYQIIAENADLSIAYSNDGLLFATVMNSGFGDVELTLYDTNSLLPIRMISANNNLGLGNLVFGRSSDIIIGSNIGELVVWSLHDEQMPMLFKAHNTGITDITINQNGTLIATSSQDGTVQVWGIPSTRE